MDVQGYICGWRPTADGSVQPFPEQLPGLLPLLQVKNATPARSAAEFDKQAKRTAAQAAASDAVKTDSDSAHQKDISVDAESEDNSKQSNENGGGSVEAPTTGVACEDDPIDADGPTPKRPKLDEDIKEAPASVAVPIVDDELEIKRPTKKKLGGRGRRR
eukprot:SAG31_NODE_1038_length_10218_cov_16.418223_10_plen_160_part_00